MEISGWYHHHEQNKNLEANIEREIFLAFIIQGRNGEFGTATGANNLQSKPELRNS